METIASLIVLVARAADKNRINDRKALIINMQKSNQRGTWRGRTRLPLESYFSGKGREGGGGGEDRGTDIIDHREIRPDCATLLYSGVG